MVRDLEGVENSCYLLDVTSTESIAPRKKNIEDLKQ
jgi:hypothetical protein